MKSTLAVTLLFLVGCATGAAVPGDTVVPGGGFEGVRGEARLVVRTFLTDGEQSRREVSGALCRLDSSLFTTEFETPTRLAVPNFGPQSPELSVACTAGEFGGGGRVRIETRWQYPPGYGPIAQAYPWRGQFDAAGVAGWGWNGPAFPVSDYPDLDILLR